MSTSKIERLQQARTALADRAFRVLFYTPDTEGVPSGAIIEIYQLAATLRRQGYDASILSENPKYVVPRYLDEDLQAVPHFVIGDKSLLMKPEDILVIPEYFTSVMLQTAKLPCLRVVLVQGYDNALINMIPGTSWTQMGITQVWTMGKPLTEFIEDLYGGSMQVETLRIGLPEYFQPTAVKDPVIAVQVRNALDLKKISNEFYARFPELRWVGFEPLSFSQDNKGRTRREYAQMLAKSMVVLWVDRVAAFGQTAIEAMACQTPIVGLVPDHDPEYLSETNGVWVNRFPELARNLGNVFKLSMENGLPEWLTTGMQTTAEAYSAAAAEAVLTTAFAATLARRDLHLQDLITHFENKDLLAAEVA